MRLLTVHEFLDDCNAKCVVKKERCERYHSVKDYITHLETRHERRKDMLACEAAPRPRKA